VNLERLRRAPNVAIVGSSSPVGKELKELVQETELPIGKLKLLETEEYAGLLQEFAGQIEITQILAPSSFDNIDIAFFACSPLIIKAYAASGSSFPELTIDLTQTGREGTMFLSGISDRSLIKESGYFISPHPSVIVLAKVLSTLERAFPIKSVTATLLEPASERGSAAIDELQEQTVGLLNFQPVEHRLFKGQIAFNLLPETNAAVDAENLIRTQFQAIFGSSIPIPSLMTLQAPVFHSESFSLFVRTDRPVSDTELRKCFEESKGAIVIRDNPEDAASPVGAIGSEKIQIGRIAPDPMDANLFSLWITADNLRISAANALGIAEVVMLTATSPR
jgi:aspartate-semialdehyde dehydrogenase